MRVAKQDGQDKQEYASQSDWVMRQAASHYSKPYLNQ